MKEITVLSFGKINLSLDVKGVLPSGMHQVDMVMQQISFHDDVKIRYSENKLLPKETLNIDLKTNRYYLPVDERNLAYKAATLMFHRFSSKIPSGDIDIEIFKRIPVAAGLAGGSGNGAAVLHGLNSMWNLNLTIEELLDIGMELGSDVPFSVAGLARANFNLPHNIRKSPRACSAARASGTGTTIETFKGISRAIVIAKPKMSVSTREVYANIDNCNISERPNNDKLVEDIKNRDYSTLFDNCINVLECYTLKAYPKVAELKALMQKDKKAEKVMMSGSGPTVFAVYENIPTAKIASESLRKAGYESYWTRTTK